MTKRLIYPILAMTLIFVMGLGFFSGQLGSDSCVEESACDHLAEMPSVYEGFVEQWNQAIAEKQRAEMDQLKDGIRRLDESLLRAAEEQKQILSGKKQLLLDEMDELNAVMSDGPFIRELKESDVPGGLRWNNGVDAPDIGDERALKGGRVALWNPAAFPSTLRPFGPNSMNFFNYSLYVNVDMMLVNIHPDTGAIIPGVASEWAVGDNGRTVYYKINEKAAYSDGRPVRARDYLLNICLRVSPFAADPYYKELYGRQCSSIRTYGDRVLSITLPRAKPMVEYVAARYHYPANPRFYADFDASYVNKYQWRVPPTTGGYTVEAEDVARGRQITLRRVKNWWAKDMKYYRNSCNVDAVTHRFISDETKAIELFKVGEIDAMTVHKPELWNNKLEIEPVFDGYIEKMSLKTEFPLAPYGLYLNAAQKPLDDENVRKGVHHAMDMDGVLDRIFQGDMPRLDSYASGYGDLTDGNIKAREYSPEKAREYFARAGYTTVGKDGILRNDKGEKLTIELSFIEMSVLIANVCQTLKQGALAAGLELKPDVLESSVCSRKVFEKRHQAVFWAWTLDYPLPRLMKTFHSSGTYDDSGRLVPYTDNIMGVADPLLDQYLMEERKAETLEAYKEATHNIQQRIHDLAVWVPAWGESIARTACWRWVKWPDSETTRFCYPAIYDPLESHLYWVDPSVKEETQQARKNRVTYPEKDLAR